MEVSNKGLAIIKRFEGCHLKAYRDPVGIPTIGYGHIKNVTMGMEITQAQADAFLKEDCKKAEANVNKYLNKYKFNQNQFDALVSFAFNIGSIDRLTANGTRSISKISQMIPAYCNAGGHILQGLVNRRNAERELFDTPVLAQEEKVIPTTEYVIGKVYTLQSSIYVKCEPSIHSVRVGYKALTVNAKKHDPDKNGSLEKGTKITCKDIFIDEDSNTWIKCPSGWLCAIYGKEVLIK